MTEEIIFAAIAGLLHDIGKFALRAGVELKGPWIGETKSDFGHPHALATYYFVQKFIPSAWRVGISGAANHHRPKQAQDYQVQLADWLSSAEREENEDQSIPRLESIFGHLSSHKGGKYLPMTRLNPQDENKLFPVELDKNTQKATADKGYADLWADFEQECRRRFQGLDSPELYLESLYNLMLEYTWCIPSAYWKGIPDISLYDHARTTAALAACLSADQRKPDWCKTARGKNDPICLLVGADLSGLQKFIYNISSSGAAKSLRARSFYIQLLEEVLSLFVLEALQLPSTNILYVGGGGFQLLAPLSAATRLNELAVQINTKLLALHQGEIGLILEWETLNARDFEAFNQARDRLGTRILRAKRRPFAQVPTGALAQAVGTPYHRGGDPLQFCSVTGEDGDSVELDEDGAYKSKFVRSLEDLGKVLPKAKFLAVMPVNHSETPALATGWQSSLETFGYYVAVIANDRDLALPVLPTGRFTRVWSLQPIDASTFNNLPASLAGLNKVFGYWPFAQLTPLDRKGNPQTFDELAKPIRGKFERWGVLRMDVDNLGLIFRNGFGESASLSRVASLSLMLRLFFEGWLPKVAGEKLKDHLYIQYAGGDDLFVVGSWDALPEFATRVRDSFAKFTCDNPALTISGGIALADAGFPLDQAAEQAGEAEETAKNFRPEKDVITFLGIAMDWASFRATTANSKKLADGIATGNFPRNLIQAILSLRDEMVTARQEAKRAGKRAPTVGRWTWMAAYQFTRLAKDTRKEEDKQYIESLRDELMKPDVKMDALGLAARWAQYWTRGE